MPKIPARGHKVEKHHSEGNNVRRTLHTKIKRKWYQKKKLGKTASPKKEKETRVAIGALAYRRTLERRAAASKHKDENEAQKV